MSKPISEELLSAYLDGELSPEERAEAERLLRECNLHRDCLEELIDLSQALRALPCCSAPKDLRDYVLERLHHTAAAVQGKPSGVPKHRWTRLSSLVTAALALTIGIVAFNHAIVPPEQNQLAVQQNEVAEMQLIPFSRPKFSSLPVPQHAVANAPAPVVGMDRDQIRVKLLELGHAPIPGNSIQVTADTDVVVEFTVVDVNEAFDQLQVLLKERPVNTSGINESHRDLVRTYPLRVLCLQLEGSDREVVEVLNQVPALDAIAFVEDGATQKATLQQTIDDPILAEVAPDLPEGRFTARSGQPNSIRGSGAQNVLVGNSMPRVYQFDQLHDRTQQRRVDRGLQHSGQLPGTLSFSAPQQPSENFDAVSIGSAPAFSNAKSARGGPMSEAGDAQAPASPEEAIQRIKALVLLRKSPTQAPQKIAEQ